MYGFDFTGMFWESDSGDEEKVREGEEALQNTAFIVVHLYYRVSYIYPDDTKCR